jgi:hypothetical protein
VLGNAATSPFGGGKPLWSGTLLGRSTASITANEAAWYGGGVHASYASVRDTISIDDARLGDLAYGPSSTPPTQPPQRSGVPEAPGSAAASGQSGRGAASRR